MHSFEIILVYFERPNIVKNALNSLNDLEYDNFHLTIIDDGSRKEFAIGPVAKEILRPDIWQRTSLILTGDSVDYKESINGSRHGEFMNAALRSSDADVAVILCDDDALVHDVLNNVDDFFTKNPDEQWVWGRIIPFNPEHETLSELPIRDHPLNRFRGRISPAFNIDSTQVIYKRKAVVDKNILYPSVGMGAFDASIYQQIEAHHGQCPAGNFYTQYKADFRWQMGSRPNPFQTGDN